MQTSPVLLHPDPEFDIEKLEIIQILQALEAAGVTTTWCNTNPHICRIGSTTMVLTLVDFSHHGW